jgi:hypothetical protein
MIHDVHSYSTPDNRIIASNYSNASNLSKFPAFKVNHLANHADEVPECFIIASRRFLHG